MGIKVNLRTMRTRALEMFFLIVFILDYQCFYLFGYPSWMNFLKNNQLNLTVSAISIMLTLICYKKFKRFNGRLYTRLLLYSVLCLLVWGFLVIYSTILYPKQPLVLTLGFHATFLYAFLIIPCLSLFYLKDDINRIFMIMNSVACVWYVLLIYQHIKYATSFEMVFNIQELVLSTTRDLERDYGIRLSLKSLGNLMMLYNFDVVFNRKTTGKSRLFSLIQLLLGLYCLIIVQQTRAMILVVAVSLAGIAVFGAKKLNKKVVVFALGLVIVGILYYNGTISKFLFSFSTSSYNKEALGTSIRINALIYYLDCFGKTFMLGNGFTSDYYYFDVQHGVNAQFYYSDIGIIGLFGETGMGAIVFYVVPLWRSIKTAFLAIRKKCAYEYAFFMGIVIYLIVSSATLIITAKNTMIAFPIIIAYTEFTYTKIKNR